MDAPVRANSAVNILITVILVLGGLVALYYLYQFLFGIASVQTVTLVKGDVVANKAPMNIPEAPQIYEGGDYTVTMWLYINSYNINRNRRKHIFELAGANFSTLLVGLGAFKNTLMVRTHSREPDAAYSGTDAYGRPLLTTTDVYGANAAACSSSTGVTNATPNSQDAMRTDGSLTKPDIAALFKPLAMDDTLMDTSPACDLPEIDMQRWTHVTVVLSGRVIDVYVDGKLARSCVTKSYFKVDPTGVKVKMLEAPNGDGENGFDGHVSNVNAVNIALSPADIYKLYANGPFGNSTDVLTFATSFFKFG